MPLDSNARDVALDILDRALHPRTSDAEAIASIHAWRRKTGNALIREVVEPNHPVSPEEPPDAAEIVWRSIQRRDSEIAALRSRLAVRNEENESLRRRIAVETDRSIRSQQELEAAKAKIAELEGTRMHHQPWWKGKPRRSGQ